jgi:hypothetical protein
LASAIAVSCDCRQELQILVVERCALGLRIDRAGGSAAENQRHGQRRHSRRAAACGPSQKPGAVRHHFLYGGRVDVQRRCPRIASSRERFDQALRIPPNDRRRADRQHLLQEPEQLRVEGVLRLGRMNDRAQAQQRAQSLFGARLTFRPDRPFQILGHVRREVIACGRRRGVGLRRAGLARRLDEEENRSADRDAVTFGEAVGCDLQPIDERAVGGREVLQRPRPFFDGEDTLAAGKSRVGEAQAVRGFAAQRQFEAGQRKHFSRHHASHGYQPRFQDGHCGGPFGRVGGHIVPDGRKKG